MQEVAKRVRQLRNFKEMNQEEFGELVGLSQTQISHIENARHIDRGTIARIVMATGVSQAWLEEGKGEMLNDGKLHPPNAEFNKERGRFIRLPLIDLDVAASDVLMTVPDGSYTLNNAWQEQMDVPIFEEIHYDERTAIFRIKGDSMEERFQDNDKLLSTWIDPSRFTNYQGNAVVSVKEKGLFFKKTAYAGKGMLRLSSTNEFYPPFEERLDDIMAMWRTERIINGRAY
ncbi:MAG: helix-turn-helix domain-containing protein [Verrucomicrobia bacterium]|nr:helix-turn-helix domain-containing protein [Cytophagales bacterium]